MPFSLQSLLRVATVCCLKLPLPSKAAVLAVPGSSGLLVEWLEAAFSSWSISRRALASDSATALRLALRASAIRPIGVVLELCLHGLLFLHDHL